MRNFLILEGATDRRSVKIGILKSLSKLLEKYLGRRLFSKATGNNPKVLLKMNSFPNIFQVFQITDTLQNSYFGKCLLREVQLTRYLPEQIQ